MTTTKLARAGAAWHCRGLDIAPQTVDELAAGPARDAWRLARAPVMWEHRDDGRGGHRPMPVPAP